MIKHTQKIKIKADCNKVWFFLMNFSQSLIYDKYYYKVDLPSSYSVNQHLVFKIFCKYFFHIQEYKALIKTCLPPKEFSIKVMKNSNFSYMHKKIFVLKSIEDNKTLLSYTSSGMFKFKALNIFFNFFIKASCLNELKCIKVAIESSELDMRGEKYNTLKL